MDVRGVDHVYLSVRDMARSEAFYDRVMRLLGFRKGDKAIAGEPHAHYFNRSLQLSIRPARGEAAHDPYAPGLHHLCLQVGDRDAVDETHRLLRAAGVDATAPRRYPEYNPDYYATFFQDPDGVRLEVVARTPYRDDIVRHWDELRTFLNPLADLAARRGTPASSRSDAGAAETPDVLLRRVLWVTAVANVAVAGLLLFPASSPGLLVGLPGPSPHVLYRALLALFVGLFGGLYVWLARQPRIPRPFIAFAAVGKSAFVVVTLGLWLAGAAAWRWAAAASGDLVFVAVFVWWLARTREERPRER